MWRQERGAKEIGSLGKKESYPPKTSNGQGITIANMGAFYNNKKMLKMW